MARDGSGVTVASSSSYQITFMYNGVLCRERVKAPMTKEGFKRVEAFRTQIVEAIESGYFDYAVTFPKSKRAAQFAAQEKRYSLSEYLLNWLEIKKSELHNSTIEGYEKIIKNQILPNLGHIYLDVLTRQDVRNWIGKYPDVTNKTIRNRLSPLRAALEDAATDGLVDENILKNFSYKNPKNNKRKIKDSEKLDPYTKAEQEAILGVLTGQAHNLVKFWFWTGLRTSELIALEWSDVDLEKGTVNVNKALTDAASEPEDTKTATGNRVLKLLPPALEAIRDQVQYTHEQKFRVFNHPKTNLPLTGANQLRKTIWIPALHAAKVRYRKPYHVRHTFASMMISSGENIHWLSKYLGHTDAVTTQRFYAVWLKDANDDAGMLAVEKYYS